jgi:hypothetical protein
MDFAAICLDLVGDFAFITLSTLGYADVLPPSPAAKVLCISLRVIGRVIGPFDLSVVMGMLNGRFINQEACAFPEYRLWGREKSSVCSHHLPRPFSAIRSVPFRARGDPSDSSIRRAL